MQSSTMTTTSWPRVPIGPAFKSHFLNTRWIAGVELVEDPRVWVACFRFLMSNQLSKHLLAANNKQGFYKANDFAPSASMLLLFYGTVTGSPTCYEVNWFSSDWGSPETMLSCQPQVSFNLHTNLHSLGDVNDLNDAICFDLNLTNYGDRSKQLVQFASCLFPTLLPTHENGMCTNEKLIHATSNSTASVSGRCDLNSQCSQENNDPLQFNVPDVSLLLEEGVAVCNEQLVNPPVRPAFNAYMVERIVHSPDSPRHSTHAEDSIPRQLPLGSPGLQHTPLTSNQLESRKLPLSPIRENEITTYNPNLYAPVGDELHESSQLNAVSNQATVIPTVNSEVQTNDPLQIKAKPPNPSALHSLLATLPPSQLKRLEQIILSLLQKSKNRDSNEMNISPTCDGQAKTSASQVIGSTTAVDAAVNTSHMLTDNRVLLLNACSENERQSVGNQRLSNGVESNRSQRMSSPAAIRASAPLLKSTSTTDMDSPRSTSTTGNNRLTLAELGPLLRLNPRTCAQSSPALNLMEDPPAQTHDKYKHLLTSIQNMLDRSPKSIAVNDNHLAIEFKSTMQAPPPMVTPDPERGDSICDYPLERIFPFHDPTAPCISTMSDRGHSRPMTSTWQGGGTAVAERMAYRETHDRVTDWLGSSTAMITSGTVLPLSAQLDSLSTDSLKCTGLDSTNSSRTRHSPHDNPNTYGSDASTNNLTDSYYPDNNTETDQSIFLSGLVEKYLGPVVANRTKASTHKVPVPQSTRLTRHSPTDVSMATHQYLQRHGLLDSTESGTRTNRHTHSNRISHRPSNNLMPNSDGPINPGSALTSSTLLLPTQDTSTSLYDDSVRPITMLAGGLENAILADTYAHHDVDMTTQWLPTLTETSSLLSSELDTGHVGDGGIAAAATSLSNQSNSCERILDMDKLRALPKLL